MHRFKQAAAELEKTGVAVMLNEPMALHTSFCIGGPAGVFCRPTGAAQVAEAVRAATRHGLPSYFLGKGTNILMCDTGYPGVMIHLSDAMGAIAVAGNEVRAGAGAALSAVCEAARDAGLTGLEFAYGIPGSVGGAVYMDAGAYGGEVRQVLKSVTYLDENGTVIEKPVSECELGYRASIFQKHPWCILEAVFDLKIGEKSEINAVMENHMRSRREKQPLEWPSAGSTFKRPEGAFAGALIDQSGLRGYAIGGAAISEKHSGFIVNLGGATCADVLALADFVAKTVYEKTGHRLEKEIRVVGAMLTADTSQGEAEPLRAAGKGLSAAAREEKPL